MWKRRSMLLPSLLAIVFCGQSLQAAGAVLTFSPSSVTLSGNSGGPPVTQVVTLLNNGSGATDWVMGVDPTAPWLTASPASGKSLAAGGSVSITVTANPANLKPNSSPGYVANITPQGATFNVPLGVTFNVSGTSIAVSPNPINLSVLAGTQQVFQNEALIIGNASVSITVTSGAWLTADTGAQAPAPFSIIVNARTLNASSTPYQGNLLIQCIGGFQCIAQNVPVNLTVYSQLTLSCAPTAGPAQVGVAYSTTCAASGGNNSYLWQIGAGSLPSGLSLSSMTGKTIQVSGTPSTAGPYRYAISVNDTSAVAPQTASQTFSGTIVPPAPPTLSASPASLPFGSYIVGGAAPPAQSISLSSASPASGLAFTSTLGSDCAWLTLSPTAGSTPASVTATINVATATPGNHSCLITFNASGVSPSPTVTATLTIAPANLSASPASLSFGSYMVGGAAPAAQSISLSSASPASGLAFTSTLGSDCVWLTLSPTAGSTPASVTASVNVATATPGNHSCLITFNANGVSPSPTVTATLTIGPGNAPVISAIVNAAGFNSGGPITTGSWVAVFGANLAPAGDSRQWNTSTEIVNGVFPTSLDGTSVTVNGKHAAVEFISPTQMNIQPPDDTAVGPVQVVISTTAGGASAPFTANYAQFAPGLFLATTSYLAVQHADGSYVGGYAGATPAKPGEVIVLWGTGFGPASPPVPAGQVFTGTSQLVNGVTVTIGGQPATVDFAGVVGAGLVQINVHVPSSINNGDAAVLATVNGVSTQAVGNLIAVHN